LIRYVHVDRPAGLELGEIGVTSDVLANTDELARIALKLRTEAVNKEISVMVELRTNFRPTGVVRSPAVKHVVSNLFSGIFIKSLDIRGDFAYDVTYSDKVSWWKHMQRFVTNMGFKFRENAEITCYSVMPDHTFTKRNQWSGTERMSHLTVNVDGFVFE
jgi:hypothetical protein